jgi:uncharacterized protein (TIGR02453 family)
METIKKSTLRFLSDLKRNNDRDWFNLNRSRYQDAKGNFESFIQAVIDEIARFDPIIKGLEAKSCIFRINRDIRFSPDKSIYKTNFGAFIVKGGRKNGDRFAGYYIHAEPGENMIAGGAYIPPAPWLSAIREKIDEEGEKLAEIINNREFKKFFSELEGEKLRSAPKGYAKDHPHIELLKLKSFLGVHMISDRDMTGENIFQLIIGAARALKPLNDFLNDY